MPTLVRTVLEGVGPRAVFPGLLGSLLAPSSSHSADMPFQVLPWNGYKAAISLTYDDGDPIHLDLVIPEMDKRGMRGTFFLVTRWIDRPDAWTKAAETGHEIGNHTRTHRHAAELKANEEKDEVAGAREDLEKLVGRPVLGFAYPFVEITEGLKKWIDPNALAARGGYAASYYLTPDSVPDWMNIPSQATMTNYTYDNYKFWVDRDLELGAWTVLMIHAIEGSNMWQPVPKDIYLKFLDYLARKRKDLWIAPFSEVGAYWKAQKAMESASFTKEGARVGFRWMKPDPFPKGVVLKVRVPRGVKAVQGGRSLKPLSGDTYPVDFDAEELVLEGSTWEPGDEIPPPPES